MRRGLDDERFDQNKVLYSSSGGKQRVVKLPLQAPQRFLRQEDRSPATRRLLVLESH